MAFSQLSKLSILLFALAALAITLVHAAVLDNRQDIVVEPTRGNHWNNGLPLLVNSAPILSDSSVGPEDGFEAEGGGQHAIAPQPLTSAISASVIQRRAPDNADLTSTGTAPITSLTCTTTIWQFPTPYQLGPKSSVWTSTFTETVYYDCHGCAFVISYVPSTSTHFHRTTTISSILTQLTPTCYDPPGIAPWLSTTTTGAAVTPTA